MYSSCGTDTIFYNIYYNYGAGGGQVSVSERGKGRGGNFFILFYFIIFCDLFHFSLKEKFSNHPPFPPSTPLPFHLFLKFGKEKKKLIGRSPLPYPPNFHGTKKRGINYVTIIRYVCMYKTYDSQYLYCMYIIHIIIS